MCIKKVSVRTVTGPDVVKCGSLYLNSIGSLTLAVCRECYAKDSYYQMWCQPHEEVSDEKETED